MRSLKAFAISLLVLCIISTVFSVKWYDLKDYTFKDYVKEFSRQYSPKEYTLRKDIFEAKLQLILSHNQDETSSYKKGVNQFTDRTDEEFKRLLGYKKQWKFSSESENRKDSNQVEKAEYPLPNYVDWREKGILTAVKNQGQCGSCWAFATTEVVESYWALATGILQDLSIQQILDCTPNPQDCGGNGGCGGGTPDIAYNQLIKQGGQAAEWTYPYQSYFNVDFPTCKFNASMTTPQAVLKGFTNIEVNSYEKVINALVQGPLAINVDASAWQDYESGIFTGCNQTYADIDHVVQLVGYGTDYWLIRNSWAPTWGEQGFIRLPKTDKTECAIDIYPQDGTGCNAGPSNVTVCGPCGLLYEASFPIVDRK